MSKFIGMFDQYCPNEDSKTTFFNFFPVTKINTDYPNNTVLDDLNDYDSPDSELFELMGPGRKFVTIHCNTKQDFYEAKNNIMFDCWCVMDSELALEYMEYNERGGRYIPYDEMLKHNIFSSLKENGLSLIVDKKSHDYSKSDPMFFSYDEDEYKDVKKPKEQVFFLDEQYYVITENERLSGPYSVIDNKELSSFGVWKSSVIIKPHVCDVEYYKNTGELSLNEEYSKYYVLNEDLIPVTVKKRYVRPKNKNTIFGNPLTCVSQDYNYEKLGVKVNLEKEAKEFKYKEFRREILDHAHGLYAKYILIELSRCGVTTTSCIVSHLKNINKFKKIDAIEYAFTLLNDKGYTKEYSLEDCGKIVVPSKKGWEIYKSESACQLLGIKKIGEVNIDELNEESVAGLLCYTNIMEMDIRYIKSKDLSSDVHQYGANYIYFKRDKDNNDTTLVAGIFSHKESKEGNLEETFAAYLDKKPSRVIICCVDLQQCKAISDVLLSKYKEKISESNTYIYSWHELDFYQVGMKEKIDEENVFVLTDNVESTIYDDAVPADDQTDDTIQHPVIIDSVDSNEENDSEIKEKELIIENLINKIAQLQEEEKDAESKSQDAKLRSIDLEKRNNNLEESIRKLEEQESKYRKRAGELIQSTANRVDELLSNPDIARVTIDDYLASKVTEAASRWTIENEDSTYEDYISVLSSLDSSIDFDLVEYIVSLIQNVRPNYKRNDILNIMICLVQGFITVFSGEPGSGKTSICDILGQVLGLNIPISGGGYKRYIPVSVGRGWTSERDFIGYYNPLSKSFDCSNQLVYDAFKILNVEDEDSKYPMVILLDEANLSPMEHYWSEFIRICDDREHFNKINCGGADFSIPETLRFVATINNDDTTTTLSPRMIDRAWIINLPQLSVNDYTLTKNYEIDLDEMMLIPWNSLYEKFGCGVVSELVEKKVMDLLQDISTLCKALNINISYRTCQAMMGYCEAAIHVFDSDSNPLDFIIAQRILPKINGVDNMDEDYSKSLKKLKEYCISKNYVKSVDIINTILGKGKDLGYYQFF